METLPLEIPHKKKCMMEAENDDNPTAPSRFLFANQLSFHSSVFIFLGISFFIFRVGNDKLRSDETSLTYIFREPFNSLYHHFFSMCFLVSPLIRGFRIIAGPQRVGSRCVWCDLFGPKT